MSELDPHDPLIAALSVLAEPLRPPLPPVEVIVERHDRRRHRGRGRRSTALAALAVAASIALFVGITRGGDGNDGLEVHSTEPTTYSSIPLPDSDDPAADGRIVGERVLDHQMVVTRVRAPSSPVTDGLGRSDPRQGSFGPFGPDRVLRRPDSCVPGGPADTEYTVTRTYIGKYVQLYAPDTRVPAVIDMSPVEAGEDGDMQTVMYPAVLVLTDRSPLTYTATFPDGSTERITSDDPAVPLFGRPVANSDAQTLTDLPAGRTTVTATDSRGNQVWTLDAVDPYPWITTPDCNGPDPATVGVAASADVLAAAKPLIEPTLESGPAPADVVDQPPAEFLASIDQLRTTYLVGRAVDTTVTDVRVAGDGTTWAYISSTSKYIGRKWLEIVDTPAGWRITRQSLCAMVPVTAVPTGCADVMPVFDPADPT